VQSLFLHFLSIDCQLAGVRTKPETRTAVKQAMLWVTVT